jgi:diguanylate cyclase (GGDEF)-like protein
MEMSFADGNASVPPNEGQFAGGQQFHHLLMIEDVKGLRQFVLNDATCSIGRSSNNGIILYSNHVSRYHATLLRVPIPRRVAHFFRIIDGNLQGKRSTNGLLINGKRKFSHVLSHGDEIIFSRDARAFYQVIAQAGIDYGKPEEQNSALIFDQGPHNLDYEGEISADVHYLDSQYFFSNMSRNAYGEPSQSLGDYGVSDLDLVSADTTTSNVTPNLLGGQKETHPNQIPTGQDYETNLVDQDQEDADIADPDEEGLARLASFPELSPYPILELNIHGEITYVNPEGLRQFPDIYEQGMNHPLFEGILEEVHTRSANASANFFVREVTVKERILEQSVHIIGWTELIRSYVTDITVRKQAESMIQYYALHDVLTQLPNRKALDDHLAVVLPTAATNQEQVGIFFFDVDDFKLINDSLGHTSGDRLLVAVSQRLQGHLREDDLLCRWGGDEFVLVRRRVGSAPEIADAARLLLGVLQMPFYCEGQELHITTSIGISIYPSAGDNAETLIKNADTAMYRAKKLGRNNFILFTPDMHDTSLQRLELENSLRRAIDNGLFVPYYQPQVDTLVNKIIGVEVLLRWHDEQQGFISPARFIPAAEETGLIVSIGYWLLRKVLRQCKVWQDRGIPPLRISVNVSLKQLMQADFVDMLANILAETSFDPQYLELELTESVMMETSQDNLSKLHALRRMGIGLSIDDFGTGFSSLNYLRTMPISVLKIDRSFVNNITKDARDRAIAMSIIALAKSLDLEIIAEGIETVEQMELLDKLGCHVIQGYLFHQAMPAQDLVELLKKQTEI